MGRSKESLKRANDAKSEKLGENVSTAYHRLRKKIMYFLANKCDMLSCFRCGEIIDNIDDFSIEHKESWLLSKTPLQTFFDLNNIAFSHLKCNLAAAAPPNKKYANEKERNKADYDRLKANPEKYAEHLEDKKRFYHIRMNKLKNPELIYSI